MKIRLLCLTAMVLVLTACSAEDRASLAPQKEVSLVSPSPRQPGHMLAYEHHLDIEAPRDNFSAHFDKLQQRCINDTQYKCTILNTTITSGDYPSAQLRLRLLPAGVPILLQAATEGMHVRQRSTQVEDLAQPIADQERRLRMLKKHHDRLAELYDRAEAEIDALIKISSELSNVQANIEQLTGAKQHLLQKVNMEVLHITFRAFPASPGALKPVKKAWAEFGGIVLYSLANALLVLAYALPWLVLLGLCAMIFFALRRRARRRRA